MEHLAEPAPGILYEPADPRFAVMRSFTQEIRTVARHRGSFAQNGAGGIVQTLVKIIDEIDHASARRPRGAKAADEQTYRETCPDRGEKGRGGIAARTSVHFGAVAIFGWLVGIGRLFGI